MASLPVTRVGVFGGSFDPPHLAHVMACLYALGTGEVDEIWMVPTYRHVFGKPLTAYEDRVRMCRLLIEDVPRIKLSLVEGERGGEESRTLDTLEGLLRAHPDHRFRLVIGTDILAETDQWHRWDRVVELAPPLVIPRSGHGDPGPGGLALPGISSTTVRDLIAEGKGAVPLVPSPVMDYIATRGLYR